MMNYWKRATQSGTTKDKEFLIAGLCCLAALLIILGTIAFSAITGSYNEREDRLQQLSYREGQLDSYSSAWSEGREQGYRESETLFEYKGLAEQTGAYSNGWWEGYSTGKEQGQYEHYYR